MAYAMDAIVMEPAPSYDYDILMGVRYGSNGEDWGAPTYDLSTSSLWDGGWCTWDENPYDGIDSGWRSVDLVVNRDYVSWSVNGLVSTVAAPTFNFINQIKVVADSSAQAMMSWSNVAVSFYRDGQEVDFWVAGSGPTIDQTNDLNPTEHADILTLTSSASNVDSIHLTAMVRMTAPEGVYLDQNSVFGQVLITTA